MIFRRKFNTLLCGVVLAGAALGQGAKKEFEVATVRVRPAFDPAVQTSFEGPTEVSCVCILSTLLMEIFEVPFAQIQAPSWNFDVYYEIHAKLPEGTTKAEIPGMRRRLLEERLHLVVREEVREVPGYMLEMAIIYLTK